MIKKLLALFLFGSAVALATPVAPSTPSNVLINGQFEALKAGWTSTGTFSASSSSPISGTLSAVFSGTSGQLLSSAQYTIPNVLHGNSCSATIAYSSAEATNPYTFRVVDGSTNVLASTVLVSPTSLVTSASVYFLCPTSGTFALQVVSSGGSSSIKVDDAYLGKTIFQGVSQAQYFGGVNLPTNCNLTVNGTNVTFVDLTPAGCSGGTLLGGVSSFDSSVNGTVTLSGGPGTYVVHFIGDNVNPNGVTNNVALQITDGTITGQAQSVSYPVAQGFTGQDIIGSFTYTSGGTHNFKLQGMVGTASQPGGWTSGPAGQSIQVYYFPSSSQIAVTSDLTPGNWSGYQDVSSGWAVASMTPADFSAGSSPVTTQLTARNISCGNAGTDAGISCQLPRTGNYQVCASVNTQVSQNVSYFLRLVDGTGTIINRQAAFLGLVSATPNVNVCGHYNALAVSSPIELKLQGWSSDGSSMNLGANAANWSIIELDAAMPTPVLVGGVTSSGPAQQVAVSATLACASSASVIYQTGSWISSIANRSSSTCAVTFAAGTFSAAPTCVAQERDGDVADARARSISSSGLTILGAAASDFNVAVICMGPH